MEGVALTSLVSFLEHRTSFNPSVKFTTLAEAVHTCYPYFNEDLLRQLLSQAMKAEEERPVWSLVIDAIHLETTLRQELASQVVQELFDACSKDQLDITLQSLQDQHRIDHIVKSQLTNMRQQAETHQDSAMVTIIEHIQSHLQPSSLKSKQSEIPVEALVQSGDVNKLRYELREDFVSKAYNDLALLQVLEDNMQACRSAGYVNKLKLFIFIKSIVEDCIHSKSETIDSNESAEASISTSYHAPTLAMSDTKVTKVTSVSAIKTSFDATEIMYSNPDIKINNKKKSLKKSIQARKEKFLDSVSLHLASHGWVCVDHLLPLDVVRRVRIEANLFTEHYEQSEIWVGKEADVGAHLQVPSVRGDKVLWMCGGHDTPPEGDMSRKITTTGEIQPCKLQAKAAAPIRKFNAMRELISTCDRFVDALKAKVPHLNGIYNRSDAMLSIFPGDGARFANHIDNTTNDGRRLTVLMYLNPTWEEANGGALRITPISKLKVPGPITTDYDTLDAVDVYPYAGRAVLFYSAEIPHEVCKVFGKDRHAITIWYYDKTERQEAVIAAEERGYSTSASSTSVAAQLEAKTFMSSLMGGDDVGEDGGEPTAEELEILMKRVTSMSEEALNIAASITGAKSPLIFKEGFKSLTVRDLKSMRSLFRRMGLN